MSRWPGEIVGGRYELIELAGEGGTAEVWRAVRRGAAGFALPVAVKLIRPEFRLDDDYVAMFVEEARVGAELQHANIVQVHDFGEESDRSYYLVMEWVEGVSLARWCWAYTSYGLRTPWPIVAAIAIEALRALGAAHNRKKNGQRSPVVHRDVSPENLLLGVYGAVKLSDFGFARALDRRKRTTAPGMVKGKLSYLSPEMVHGADSSPKSDLFALGAVVWEALAGRKLFVGERMEIFRQINNGEIEPLAPHRPDLPPRLVEVVHRALEPDPERRWDTAAEMAQALAEVLRGVPRISDAVLGESAQEARDRLGPRPERLDVESSVRIAVDVGTAGKKG